MKNKYKIKVKQVDIDRGVKGNCQLCPVARAIRRVIKKAPISAANHEELYVGERYFKGPEKVSTFIEVFDKGGEVKPFNFVMRQY